MATQKNFSEEEAQKRYETLPLAVKSLLYSPEMHKVVEELGKKYQLHIDKLGLLEAEIGAVMLGFIEPQDFPEILAENLGTDPKKTAEMLRDINDQLFLKIRGAMGEGAAQKTSGPKPVTMPSAVNAPKPTTPPAPAIAPKPTLPAAPITPPQAPATLKPSAPVNLAPVDMMLSQKMVTKMPTTPLTPPQQVPPPAPKPITTPPVPPATGAQTPTPPAPAPKPPEYKADPYREPPL